ncbi:FAD binding domain-containing protein [Nitriliruptor alkaliphilus]|uniref:FAD binding domain-containing protein n=1 Tax=Nitriliruptor alkaliphilus TaxID=427918 RepID=UPI0014702916|nr:FAD binding domain-containing protein [Nitriliruptor alkaliphilus]
MTIARPRRVDEAAAALAEMPDAHLLAGGTDLMVEVNLGHRRPEAIVALRRVEELGAHRVEPDRLELGATVTYTTIERQLADVAPGLAMAARTVGSPQIRNAGTVGGNVGTASPAGDALPWLLALDAEVVLASTAGERVLPLAAFITGPKRTDRRPDELIRCVRVPRVAGPQHTAKVGTRNAMVISVVSLAMIVDTDARRVRVGLGSVGPTPLRPTAAEDLASDALDWGALTCDDDSVTAFAAACAAAASPIDDHRSTADYRRHAVGVLAARCLRRCLDAAPEGAT